MNPPGIITHGCRSNLAERDALAALARPGDTVINSCAVTEQAVRDARAAVRAAQGQGRTILTGCAATHAPEAFSDLDAIILPNNLKLQPFAWQRSGARPLAVTRRSRAFVAVQDGCDHACTFCVTTLARGPSRSVPAEALIDAILALCAAGVNEVVLTGIDTSGYGADLPGTPSLGGLIQAILAAVPALARLRLSSLDAAEADPALIEAFADKRLMPHIHLSLQSGSNLILKRMKRRHSREDAIRLVETLRHVRPDIAIGADLIAGFPTEAEADHLASLALLDDCDIVHAHIFPYSERPGTIAARMPQVQKALRRARAADLRAAASARHLAFLARHIGRPLETVSEGAQGYAPDYAAVRYREPMPRGALVPVTPRGLDKETLLQ